MLEGHSLRNPLKDLDGKNFILPSRYLLQSYRNTDPAAKKELAIPVELITAAQDILKPKSGKFRRIAQLIIIAFFYLLRVGEYTKPRHQTRTVQFRFKDVMFWKNGWAISPVSAQPSELLGLQAGTLRIMNQKNGIKNQTTHHNAINDPAKTCPVDNLIELTKDLRAMEATPETLLCAYRVGDKTFHVTSNQITRTVKWLAKHCGLERKGFPIDRVGSHSLRAGGAMALKLNGVDIILIKKYGRWSSDTFLTCIHEQIAGLATGISSAMARDIKFYNIAGFD